MTVPVSTLPAVIDGLISLLNETPALRSVQIIDGPSRVDITGDFVVVGLGPEDLDVEGEITRVDLESRLEEYPLLCATRSVSGDTDQRALKRHRDRAFDMLTAVQGVLDGDPTLGGAANRAELTRWAYLPVPAADGTGVAIAFTVAVKAFRRP